MTVAMQPSINMMNSTDETSGEITSKECKTSGAANQKRVLAHESLYQEITSFSSDTFFAAGLKPDAHHRRVKSDSALKQPVSSLMSVSPSFLPVKPRVPLLLSSFAASDPLLSPQGQSESDLRRQYCSGYYPEDDDCCDDICYECCCVKDYCVYCGIGGVVGLLIWLKSNTDSVQE
jgi:hypothetical protein